MAITLHTDTVELPEQTELMVGRHRDEFQQMLDRDMATLKVATANAGWPEPDPKKLFHRYVVGADDATELKAGIRRAGTFHKVEPVFYKDGKTEAGHVSVKFHVARATVEKDGKVSFRKDDTLTEDGKPTAEFVKATKAANDAAKAEAAKANAG